MNKCKESCTPNDIGCDSNKIDKIEAGCTCKESKFTLEL